MAIYNEFDASIIPEGHIADLSYMLERNPLSEEVLEVSAAVSALSDDDRVHAANIANSVQSTFAKSTIQDFQKGKVDKEKDLHFSVSSREVANIATLANALFAVNNLSDISMDDLQKNDESIQHPSWVRRLVSLSTKKPHGLIRAGVIPENPDELPDVLVDYSNVNTIVDQFFKRSSIERLTGRRSAEAELFAKYERERREILKQMSEGEERSPRTAEEAMQYAEIETARDRELDRVEILRNDLTKDMMEADLMDPFVAQSFETRKREIERQYAAIIKEYTAKVALLYKNRGGDAELEVRLRAIERKQEHLLQRQSFRKTYSYYPF